MLHCGRGAPKWPNENGLFRAPYLVLMRDQVRDCEMADQLIFMQMGRCFALNAETELTQTGAVW